jgi:HlyD family secretion protein
LRVPIGALFRGPDGGWRVFVVERGRTIERSVKIGHLNDEFGEVIDGLAENQSVVLNPGGSIASGSKVQSR